MSKETEEKKEKKNWLDAIEIDLKKKKSQNNERQHVM